MLSTKKPSCSGRNNCCAPLVCDFLVQQICWRVMIITP
ncbi:unnamed protein product [Amoebophrya sp. A25]|nr:unnamed protein product [Amoebophrya sp. A25]|eukprot:GSA25T00000485001.1